MEEARSCAQHVESLAQEEFNYSLRSILIVVESGVSRHDLVPDTSDSATINIEWRE